MPRRIRPNRMSDAIHIILGPSAGGCMRTSGAKKVAVLLGPLFPGPCDSEPLRHANKRRRYWNELYTLVELSDATTGPRRRGMDIAFGRSSAPLRCRDGFRGIQAKCRLSSGQCRHGIGASRFGGLSILLNELHWTGIAVGSRKSITSTEHYPISTSIKVWE